jgi:adenylate cyclase
MTEQQASTPHGKILVVDDNEMNREVLGRRLERQGYTVGSAENGRLAIDKLMAEPYDLMLLDIMMPVMNGYEVLEEIRKIESLRHVAVIVISAVDELDSIVKAIELGAQDYLFKPFNPVLLKARVNATMQRRATDIAAARQYLASAKTLAVALPGSEALVAELDKAINALGV